MCRRLTLVLACLLALPATASAARLGERPLEPGDRGGDVRRLQAALERLHVADLDRDGAYGPQTRRAVRRYERREHLAVDGAVSTGQARGILRRVGWTVPPPAEPSAAPAPTTGDGADRFPVGGRVTWGDGFHARGGAHDGVDLMAACGTPLVSVAAAEVTDRGSGGAAGTWLALTEPDGQEWIYMHLSAVDVEKGATLAAGDPVGKVGQTGNATACHLHAELRPAPGRAGGADPVDPAPRLRASQR